MCAATVLLWVRESTKYRPRSSSTAISQRMGCLLAVISLPMWLFTPRTWGTLSSAASSVRRSCCSGIAGFRVPGPGTVPLSELIGACSSTSLPRAWARSASATPWGVCGSTATFSFSGRSTMARPCSRWLPISSMMMTRRTVAGALGAGSVWPAWSRPAPAPGRPAPVCCEAGSAASASSAVSSATRPGRGSRKPCRNTATRPRGRQPRPSSATGQSALFLAMRSARTSPWRDRMFTPLSRVSAS